MYTATENQIWIAETVRRAQQELDRLCPKSWWPDRNPSHRVTSLPAQAVRSLLAAFDLRTTASRAKVIAWKCGADLEAVPIRAGNGLERLFELETFAPDPIDMDAAAMAGGS